MQNDMRDRLINLISGAGYDYDDFIEESHERGLSVTEDFEEWCADHLIANDVVPVVRCKDCKHSRELDKHCEINRTAYRHCALCKGDETKYVWHKYKKYYKDYSLVALDDYCNYGERKEDNG